MEQFTRRGFAKVVAASSLTAPPALAASMPARRLGKIGFQAGILGLGAQHLGDDGVEQSLVDRFIGEAIDNGLNYVDTAPPYNLSEERLGRALKGKRDKVKVIVGGAPVSQKFSDVIGADGYAPDAASAVDLCKKLLPS